MNVFKIASRKQFRFTSPQGMLTVEDLWDLPLTSVSKTKANLDNIAKGIARELKTMEEESFVDGAINRGRVDLENKLELVKSVIATRLEEKQARVDAQKNKQEKEFLVDILEQKKKQTLMDLSPEEIEKRLASLNA